VNISCRSQVGTGANILIAGLVVGGRTSGSESVLIRASGPRSLPTASRALFPTRSSSSTRAPPRSGATKAGAAVPHLQRGLGGRGSRGRIRRAMTRRSSKRCRKGPTPPDLRPGGDTGIALAEVYDDTPAGTYTLATPRLVNISARVQVGTGTDILIAGFVIGGSTSRTVLIRASGPRSQPTASRALFPTRSSSSTRLHLLGTSEGWGGETEIVNAAASVGAFPGQCRQQRLGHPRHAPRGPIRPGIRGQRGHRRRSR